jgi:hypothetical protein
MIFSHHFNSQKKILSSSKKSYTEGRAFYPGGEHCAERGGAKYLFPSDASYFYWMSPIFPPPYTRPTFIVWINLDFSRKSHPPPLYPDKSGLIPSMQRGGCSKQGELYAERGRSQIPLPLLRRLFLLVTTHLSPPQRCDLLLLYG